jgi:hypothetical protein
MKTFTVAGVSRENGVLKFRVANDLKSRVAMLARCDNTDIELGLLPEPMTREAAAVYLLSQPGLTAEVSELLTPVASKTVTSKTVSAKPAKTVTESDDFVEPKDERIQVAMCQAARLYPGLSAQQLYDTVMATVRHFGDVEPDF